MTEINRTIAGLFFTIDLPMDALGCEITPGPDVGDIQEFRIVISAGQPVCPAPVMIRWREPMHEIHYKWNPACHENRMLDVSASSRHRFTSRINFAAPVVCLHKINGENTVTFALSETLYATTLISRISEFGYAECCLQLFCEPWPAITEYIVVLRIDRRRLPMHICLRDCAAWWDALIPGQSLPVTDAARTARYCDWYPFHGKFTGQQTERQAALAKDLGMGTFCYEAGWADDALDYTPDARKYDDFRQHVEALHRLGMPFVLWVAPSFTNPVSCTRFANQLLGPRDSVGKIENPRKAHLDPRYPQVRAYIIETYARLLRDYGIDGLFLDFIECLGIQPADEPADPERDMLSVGAAIDCLLRDLVETLRTIRPDLLIEFRQPYTGPRMLRYANILRAVDCGNCFADNRIRVLDMRLLCGSVPVHADPIMWNTQEPVESAAMQLTHTLFSVPLVSMDLEALPADHLAMVRAYLDFWNTHRDVILDGELQPLEPHNAYPVVLSRTQGKLLAAAYSNALIPVAKRAPDNILLVNATYADHLVLDMADDLGLRTLTVRDCTGTIVRQADVRYEAGLLRIGIPSNGTASLVRVLA